MNIAPYIALARPSHWSKNVFVIPGVLLAIYFDPSLMTMQVMIGVAMGILSACLVASSNYVLNEILDAEHDRHHPDKKSRPLVSGTAKPSIAYIWWVALAAVGLAIGFAVDLRLGLASLSLWIMGCVYNIPPVRSKDLPYADVTSEAINNPIRMAMGWFATGLAAAPPLSVLVAYWMFGAFLMAAKRLAEYRRIGDPERAGNYRRSFKHYTEEKLIESIMFYASLFAMMSGIFITRYRIELVLATPVVAFAMAYYMHLSFKPNSAVQHPELLFKERKLMAIVGVAFVVCTLLLFVDLQGFSALFDPWIKPRS
ncbi:MAG: UbiA prenyltransferase family protein [Kiritimatiellae bacterium]|nr:UbiA prenyltransferase family protein [Kiritimatiellia bacterium]